MKISFSLDDTKVKKKLNLLTSGVKSFREPFNKAGNDLVKLYGTEVFETQGKAVGESWRRLAEATLRARGKRSGYYARQPQVRGKILWWTGRLKKGFKKQVKKNMLRIHNTVPYFKYHQTRGGRPPQRKMLALNGRVIKITVDRVVEYLSKMVKS